MSDLPPTDPPDHPNDYAIALQKAAGIRETASAEKTRPLMGYLGNKNSVKREEYTGR
jgi:hypothetical protein